MKTQKLQQKGGKKKVERSHIIAHKKENDQRKTVFGIIYISTLFATLFSIVKKSNWNKD